jgi:hypothetical protein
MTLRYVYGTRIVIKNYMDHKEQIDRFCCKHCCGYEIRKDGSAVILCD